MILFIVLAIMALIVGAIAVVTLVVGGTAFVVVFGDLIVCAAIITLIIRWLIKRKK